MKNFLLSLLLFFACMLGGFAFSQTGPGTSNYGRGILYVTVAPSGSCASSATIQYDYLTGTIYVCQNGVWTVSGGGVASSVPFSGVTGPSTNSTAAMTIANGASLVPSNLAQITANSLWMINTDPQPSAGPTWASVSTGGSLIAAHTYGVEITFNSAVGETTPSGATIAQLVTNGCPSGTACEISVTAPTLPSTYTGYTVYAYDNTNLQTAQKITTCVNITGTCTFGSIPTTSAPPTTNPVMTAPANAAASLCPPYVTPNWWISNDNGVPQSQMYISQATNNAWTGGIPVECRAHWWNDGGGSQAGAGDPPGGDNAMIVMDHVAGIGTSATNQDRSIWVGYKTPQNDTQARYGLEAIQSELDWYCSTCTINGSPDAEVTDASFQLEDQAGAAYTSANTYGQNVIRAQYYKAGAGAASSGNYNVLNAIFTINQGTFSAGTASGVQWTPTTTVGTISGLMTAGLNINFTTSTFNNGQIGMYVHGGTPGGTLNYIIRNDSAGVSTNLNGPTTVSALYPNNVATLPVNASLTLTGALTAAQTTITAPQVPACTGGTSSYSYEFVGVDSNGGQQASNAATSPSTCENPLTSGNPATINVTNTLATSLQYGSFIRIDVYRTAGPMATGKIGSLTCTAGSTSYGFTCGGFSDTGLTASGSVPTVNSTGSVSGAGGLQTVSANFATLPACSSSLEGFLRAVKDSTTNTWGATISGSGADHVLAYCDGTNWTVAAQ
jgi:hypothetical protein